jgi:hypothetical protein
MAGEQLFDEALVARVRELVVAAQRSVFGEQRAVVGVIAVRRAARGDDELRHARLDARLEHVARADDVDRILLVRGAAGRGRDDRREVHDGVDAVFGEDAGELGRARVEDDVRHARYAPRRGHLAHVRRDEGLQGTRVAGERARDEGADVAGRAGDQDRVCHGDFSSALCRSPVPLSLWAPGACP